MKPSSVMYSFIKDQRQKQIKISAGMYHLMKVRRPGICTGCVWPATKNHLT